jgi:Zn-dependent peptidase ImmA (M78 family)/DNA-binding XRE family transcriptional regulator
MPHKSLEADIDPRVLRWARETIGMGMGDIAKRLKVTEDVVSKWESGQKRPTLIQAEKLANVYKRPLAAFFLPEPPVELPLPKDFRTLPEGKRKPFSTKTLLAIRRARRIQSLIRELAKSLTVDVRYEIGTASLSDSPEALAERIRGKLGVDTQAQFGWKNENEALNEWKKALEKQGIFVLQMGMPIEETRGFSLAEGEIPIIMLNLKDSINGRIFSLFHEYAHLLLNETGICMMDEEEGFSNESEAIERFCNHFAGAVLVPQSALLSHETVRAYRNSVTRPDEMYAELSKSFKVSQEVILRRLLISNLVSVNFYKQKRKEWEEKARGAKPRGRWGRQNPPKKCIQENGIPFISLVFESYNGEKITYNEMADYLGIRLKHIPKIEQLIRGET